YGATMGFFPVDEETCQYFLNTGRPRELVDTIRNYYKAQELFGMPERGDIEYSQLLELNLKDIEPSVAGPKRPQDRLLLPELKSKFRELFQKPLAESGYNKAAEDFGKRFAIQSPSHSATVAGGGAQASETVPARAAHQANPNESTKNTSALGELEMMNNRPT